MNSTVVADTRSAFPTNVPRVVLGAPMHEGTTHPEPLVGIPLRTVNRHGLIAGATGTGKTKTLQGIAEQLSAQGVPVVLADVKGDLSGMNAPGERSDRIDQRIRDTGISWNPAAMPVEFFSLTGRYGAQLRATVSSFGPLLLAKVLELNDTQSSVLSLVFKYADDRGLALLDFADLRAVLQHLTGDGADELKDYGVMSKQTVGVLLRQMVELEQQGAETFFGEPELDLDDLLRVAPDGRGVVSILELRDVQDKPALWSTFMLWLLAQLYAELPEVGDLERPKLVLFLDEAHLLFEGSSKALRDQIEQVARLIRSKGVGLFFVTQSPRDIPPDVLGQLGHRVQHALRAFTPDDEKALRAAARTYPRTPHYDVQSTLTSLGIGDAFVTVLSSSGTPTPPFATRIIPPVTRMGPLTDDEMRVALTRSEQVRRYAAAIDRDSAREMLARRVAESVKEGEDDRPAPAKQQRADKSALEQVLGSPVTRTVANAITRSLMGALLGKRRRRRY